MCEREGEGGREGEREGEGITAPCTPNITGHIFDQRSINIPFVKLSIHNVIYNKVEKYSISLECFAVLDSLENTSLVPRPFEEEDGTHYVRMRYFPSKSWEFVCRLPFL